MKKTWMVAPSLLFAGVSGFAGTPSQDAVAGNALSAILAQPAAAGACATQQRGTLFAASLLLLRRDRGLHGLLDL